MAMDRPQQEAQGPAPIHRRYPCSAEAYIAAEVRELERNYWNPSGLTFRPSTGRSETFYGLERVEEPPPRTGRNAPRQRQVEPDIDLRGVKVDFTGTDGRQRVAHPHRRDRAAPVPERHPGVEVVATPSGSYGQRSITSRVTVQRTFDGNPENFKRVRAATYQYTGNRNTDSQDTSSRNTGPDLSGTLLDPIYSRTGGPVLTTT